MKRLPIGVDDFKHIIDNDHYFVDKTDLIKEVTDDGSMVTLIARPRRFGKTLNMSTLQYFNLNRIQLQWKTGKHSKICVIGEEAGPIMSKAWNCFQKR